MWREWTQTRRGCPNNILLCPKPGQIAAAKTGQIHPKRRKNFGAWMGKKMTKTHRWLKSAVTTAAANPAPGLPWQRQNRNRPEAMKPVTPVQKRVAIAAR